jgi:predicted amidohydrolase YtcJ
VKPIFFTSFQRKLESPFFVRLFGRGQRDSSFRWNDVKGVIFATLFLAASPALADGLVDNANGYTLDVKGKLIRFTGLLIAKDGTVSRLLDKDDKRPKQPDFRLDARGHTLIPGLIDPGTHLMQTALGGLVRDANMMGRPIQPRERDAAFALVQPKYLERGITTVTDLATTTADWNVYRRSGDAGNLRIRILSYAADIDTMMTVAGNRPTPWLYEGRLRLAGLTVTDQEPFDDARVRNLMSRGAMDGFQIAAEPIGDTALEHSLAAIEEVALTYKGDRRWRIHARATVAPLAERLSRTGTLAIPPADETLTNLATYLPARTRDAARAAFAEDKLGTLIPGAHADFLLFDRDVIALPPAEAGQARLLETWIGGARVWTSK